MTYKIKGSKFYKNISFVIIVIYDYRDSYKITFVTYNPAIQHYCAVMKK